MTKTTVRGLRDGQYTAGTGFLTRKIKALGAEVTVARTGRVTVIDKNGTRHVYVLALDTDTHTSPLTQALADLERAAQTAPSAGKCQPLGDPAASCTGAYPDIDGTYADCGDYDCPRHVPAVNSAKPEAS